MIIVPGNLDDPRILALLAAHLEGALAVTPAENAYALDTSGLRAPEISFLAAWEGEMLLGVAALAELAPDHAEIKSMHTARPMRGRGVGAAMLRHLIDLAKARGYRRLSLETGTMDYFAPARALYRRHGFESCPPYGDYTPSPNNEFMTLALAGDDAGAAVQ